MEPQLKAIDTARFKVSVTDEEIQTAIPKNSGHCMIADAVKRCFREKFKYSPKSVQVDLQSIRLTDGEKKLRYLYLTPPAAQSALLEFDHGIQPTPFQMLLKGGQVLSVYKGPRGSESPASAKKNAARKAAISRYKNRLRVAKDGNRAPTVTKIGGSEPPEAVLSGQRRVFGLKLSAIRARKAPSSLPLP